MRCTDCGRTITPVVALDIDGTLGRYHDHFYKFACQWLESPCPPSIDYDDNLGLDLDTYRKIKLAYRQGGMKRTMPAFPLVSELTERIRMAGAEIWITTTRPYNRLDNIDPDTQEWLRRNGVLWDHVIYDPNKYEQLIACVDPERVVAVLEDLPHQHQRAKELFGPGAAMLRNNGWTSKGGWTSLSDVARQIELKIQVWKENHGASSDSSVASFGVAERRNHG